MRKILIGSLAVLVGVASAQAAITVSVTPVSDPYLISGLSAYKISVSTTAGREIFNFENLSITGVHQVWRGATTQTPWEESHPGDPEPMNSVQLANDSYLLLEPDAPLGNDGLTDVGATSESNDGLDPTGTMTGAPGIYIGPPAPTTQVWYLGVPGPPDYWFPARLGEGNIVSTGGSGGAIGLDQTYRGQTLDVAYVVCTASSTPHLSVKIWDQLDVVPTQPETIEKTQIEMDIPEPATMSLLALGACLPLLRRRR